MISFRHITTTLALSLLLSILTQARAEASPPVGDFFGRVTGPGSAGSKLPAAPTARAASGSLAGDSPMNPVQWFEKFDQALAQWGPTAADHVVLTRPFNQDAQRVKEWTKTAAKVAHNYRTLAQILKAMPFPAIMSGVKEYRDLTADWYNDAASVYEDLIKPRSPARTVEELNASLDEIKERSHSLAQTTGNLKAMDLSLRKTYQVHLARQDDALQQYVRGR